MQTLILNFGANDALYRNRISNDGITKITEILLKLLIQNLMIDNVSLYLNSPQATDRLSYRIDQ